MCARILSQLYFRTNSGGDYMNNNDEAATAAVAVAAEDEPKVFEYTTQV
jgi:hypothetical protein